MADGKDIILELELGKASLGAEVAWLSQFPTDRERLLPPRTHLQVVGGPTRRADGVTVVRVRPTVFQNVRTVEEIASARKGEISAHITGLVADLRNDYFYPDVSKRDRVLDSGLAERLAAFEQHLLARFCKYEPEWYHDNDKYKSVFLGVLREVEDARSLIADPASALSQQLHLAFQQGQMFQFGPNAQVELHSLQALQNNGKKGRLVSYDTEAGRWMVEMKDGDLLKSKPANLRLVQDEARGSSAGGGAEPTSTGGELSVGTTVEIHSLLRAPELNGVRGEIVDPPPQDLGTGRWSVKIEKEGRLVALKSSNLRLVSTPSLHGAVKKVMAMQGVVRQMQNAVSEQHNKFFQVCHSTTHARAHTHKLAPKAVD